MKLHVFSDNHCDVGLGGWTPKLAPGADVVVCAGDVCAGLPEAFRFLRNFIPAPTPIVTVAGNHSFYHRFMAEEWERARVAAEALGITLLENEAVVIGGVRFVGTALWTDYRLEGADPATAMRLAELQMNDHRLIRTSRDKLFRPDHAAELHEVARRYLDDMLAQPFDGPTVVVTHHCPHPGSVAPQYRGDALTPAFASDLSELIARRQPELWIHGHTHSSFDYRVGRTRIVCNPHGYGRENAAGFDPALTIEVARLGDPP